MFMKSTIDFVVIMIVDVAKSTIDILFYRYLFLNLKMKHLYLVFMDMSANIPCPWELF